MQVVTHSRTLDPESLDALAAWLAGVLDARRVSFAEAALLGGGAIQENWRLVSDVEGGPREGRHAWVLRTDPAARISLSLDRAAELGVLEVARKAGVAVPEPIARCADPEVVGAPFLIQAFVPGVAQARRIVRDPARKDFGESLAERLGAELAKIHSITPPRDGLGFLPIPMLPPARNEVAKLRNALTTAAEPRPALEYVLSWLDAHAPEPEPITLVHGDFRTGNYIVNEGRLSVVLDWEFAHWGDRHEDIGWMTARCWRFGNDACEAGGIGSREAFYQGYRSAASLPFDETLIPYWEIMAAAKWATVAVLQGDRYRKGSEASIELALTGLMPPEMELDALDGIAALALSGDPRWR